jgi:hypothetical protein
MLRPGRSAWSRIHRSAEQLRVVMVNTEPARKPRAA